MTRSLTTTRPEVSRDLALRAEAEGVQTAEGSRRAPAVVLLAADEAGPGGDVVAQGARSGVSHDALQAEHELPHAYVVSAHAVTSTTSVLPQKAQPVTAILLSPSRPREITRKACSWGRRLGAMLPG